ncbi:MAG: tetratricopeptide repeat protein, partial [Chloroflexota bacterium]|nr:tetratricopeptide repeat protein [Chloroflexota bacterium]
FLVSLAAVADPAVVLFVIAATLGVREEAGRELVESLIAHISDQELLLILDNLEHLLPAAPLISRLLAACPGLTVLATSRESLHLLPEREYPVPPLSLPAMIGPDAPAPMADIEAADAVSFLLDRTRAIHPSFALTAQNAPLLADICRLLDCLPLAIELASSRLRLFSPQELHARLGSRLSLLTDGARDLPDRQQTLYQTIDWSYQLLRHDERELFARLAVFSGGYTLQAAEAIAAPEQEGELVAGLHSLLEKSLIRQEEMSGRFLMLATIREYASDKLAEHGELDPIRAIHARYFLRMTEEAEPELIGPRQKAWLARLDAELGNLRAALGWLLERGEIEAELRLAAGLYRLWLSRGAWSEGRRWLEAGLERDQHPESVMGAKAFRALGQLARFQSDYERAVQHFERALAIATEWGDDEGRAKALQGLGGVAAVRGECEYSATLHEESLRIFREAGDERAAAVALGSLGVVLDQQGEYARAKQCLQEALALHRTRGDSAAVVHTLNSLGIVTMHRGELEEAGASLAESLQLSR